MSERRTPRERHAERAQTSTDRATERANGLSCAYVHVNVNMGFAPSRAQIPHVYTSTPVRPFATCTGAGLRVFANPFGRRSPFASRALSLSFTAKG